MTAGTRGFEPIAVVGRSCVLPGALSPEALFEVVRKARVLVAPPPAGAWGLDPRTLLRDTSPGPGAEYVASDHGGYVSGFDDVFDAAYFATRIEEPERLDPLVQWLLYCARTALQEAGVDEPPPGSGLVVGNLSYPAVEHTRFVQDYWLGHGDRAPKPGRIGVESDPRNRFSSGYPVHIVARAMGLTGDVFALDAACASSLYAMEIACRRLQERDSDFMLAGGVTRADPLFIHLGFTALQALSPSGRSRPLHKGADGLLPAEGAALVALKRLDDAVRDGNRVFGVIRGIGLSNDGRQSGFLAPTSDGQVRAMRAAYEQARLQPADIGLIECHATGTPRGDAVELESLTTAWADATKPVIGSLKANIGHPITASGAASLLKVLSSFEAGLFPPTPCDDPLDEIAAQGFRILEHAEPWPGDGPRRAAISNFGFGGNNAHLIVEEWAGQGSGRAGWAGRAPEPASEETVVVCAMGVIAGESVGLPAFARRLVAPRDEESTRTSEIVMPMQGLGFPPHDLEESLAQQTSILAVTNEALAQLPPLDPLRTGVYIGMCVDPESARHGLRLRLRELLSPETDIAGWRAANSKAARHLTAAGVIGCMPNIPANRVHAQRDWKAPGFTVASEELSGVDALVLAARALRAGDIDAALVGASDFSCERAHEAAVAALLPADRQNSGDAAVALVLMRLGDAERGGFPVLAALANDVPHSPPVELTLAPEAGVSEVTERFGHAHAASGLLHIAAAVVTAHLGVKLDRAGAWPAPRAPGGLHTRVRVTSFSGREATQGLASPASQSHLVGHLDVPACGFYAAEELSALADAVAAGTESFHGAVRLALVGKSEEDLAVLREHAASELRAGREPSAPGLFLGQADPGGEIAFCYTGAAAAYPGAGRDLLLAFPSLGHDLVRRFAGTPELARDLYGADVTSLDPATQLTGSSFVCQLHTELTRNVLRISPQVSLGLSSGETNSLMAFDVWHDLDDMLAEINRSGMFGSELTGECRSAARHWGLPEGDMPEWRCWRIAAPLEVIEEEVAKEPRVYVTVVHHHEDVVIGGDAEACQRVVDVVGRGKAIELGLDMIVHCPPLEPFAERWRRIHLRDTSPVPDVRFYTNAGNRAYVPTREAAADAIVRQALEPIDFPKTIERAYADGVRVFIEHGPRAILTGAIGRILEGRPHVAVALDPHESSGLEPLLRSVSKLWSAGVPMELGALSRRLDDLRRGGLPPSTDEGPVLRLAAHSPDVVWPEATEPMRRVEAHETTPGGDIMTAPPPGGFRYDLRGISAAGRPLGDNGASRLPRMPARASNGPHRAAGRAEHPAAAIFDSVAATHVEFLERQRRTHETFLALGLGVVEPTHGSPPSLVTPVEPRPDPSPVAEDVLEIAVPPPVTSAPPERRAAVVSDPSEPPSPYAPPRPGPTPNLPEPGTVWLTRAQLETHAGGNISEIFGALFEQQDGYLRQVRMPEPPLLFADRALLVEGEPGGMGKGRVVTETDVQPGAWYLHAGRMAPGVVIESGQADLLLISWLGADFLNRGERVYRLLGCDLTFYGEQPRPGDTLTYDIYVDGHAKTGDVRLFFFHYDCRVGDRLLISVRNGQAGFFSHEELAGSGGVLWEPSDDEPKADARLDPAPRLTTKRRFTREDIDHFVAGNAYRCFGEGFELAAPHTRTPNLPGGRLKLIDHVPVFDPYGGPWSRGYLRAEAHVPVDAWFYDGHFKNDPCMPGTLMADAATQALSFTMAAMGFTIRRDGWRFEPVPGEMARFLCRGQVVPDAPHTLEYEVFIEEVVDGDRPEVYAALLCRSDGFKVFGCRRFGLRLVPDYPLSTKQEYLSGGEPPRLVGPEGDVRGDHDALLACAWGKPSDAFGQMFTKFDGPLRCPRLPSPPYHFVSSVVSVDLPPGSASEGGTVVSTYEVNPDAWYFDEGFDQMPFPVLAEIMLQPCGWFASYLNFFADADGDVAFRNLDGDECILHRPLTRDVGTLTLTTHLTRHAKAAGTSIVFFEVACECDEGLVMTLTTTFGFFSPELLANQRGLRTTEADVARRDEASPMEAVSLLDGGGELGHLPGMASGRMRMLDEVTGFWPDGGEAELGRIRTGQRIDPEAWYFKAHFFEDPVQPGSLGLEALVQSARALLSMKGWLDGLDDPVWEHPVIGFPLTWRYRGQVVPTNREVVTEVEVLDVEVVPGDSVTLTVFGTQWVDGLRIYEVPSFAVRVRAGGR